MDIDGAPLRAPEAGNAVGFRAHGVNSLNLTLLSDAGLVDKDGSGSGDEAASTRVVIKVRAVISFPLTSSHTLSPMSACTAG